MRVNKYVALATGMSRRAADATIAAGRVRINDQPAGTGSQVTDEDAVYLDNSLITPLVKTTLIMNKPVGYVVSRDGQGSRTIYDLLPINYDNLKPVGRLDKDTSGLLLLTNDGDLANTLTHPSKQKLKIYQVKLHKPLQPLHRQMIADYGVQLYDGPSKFELDRLKDGDETGWQITMSEGRNRQIRRTFEALGYTVTALHRTQFGPYTVSDLKPGTFRQLE
jgi:23S rRNA pseudouridine2605 synthase